VLAITAGHDPWPALRTALSLHHRMAVAPRSYATWLLWNPYDFALLLSPAVLGLAAVALSRRTGWRPAAFAWWGSLVMLLLSGSVRGEVGRIWLIWMPFACLLAAGAAAQRDDAPARHRNQAIGRGQEDQRPGAGITEIADSAEPGTESIGWKAGVALLLATQAALTLALAATMVFVS
jgi:hypothetical protein